MQTSYTIALGASLGIIQILHRPFPCPALFIDSCLLFLQFLHQNSNP